MTSHQGRVRSVHFCAATVGRVFGWVLRSVGGVTFGAGAAAATYGSRAEQRCAGREAIARMTDPTFDAGCVPWQTIGMVAVVAGAGVLLAGFLRRPPTHGGAAEQGE